MIAYADPSFLVPLYIQESHSLTAAGFFAAQREPILISPLVLVEATNAIQLRLFRRQATAHDTAAAIRDLDADISTGSLLLKPTPARIWDVARELSLTHTRTLGTRSLDILQVASALVLNADSFLTFDRNQALLAQSAGLSTPAV